ncbi:UNVERIFIED_CONTAM: hypothetical protein Sradi_0720900 [Sesamum radiatum]|uniref:Myb/SANT-like domain-containing protein n=1 Tax=Sesamum radiatum TaxID=300843 RepID=A0AAW2VPM7_SESRA
MAAPNIPPLAGGNDDDNGPNNPSFVDPLSQAHYFYTYRWSRQCDKAFIRSLYRQARRGHRQAGRTPNMHSLSFARHFMNYVAEWNFKYRVLKNRLNHLRLRYNTF